ncbi:MAG: hypothetical protein AAGF29_10025 [Pseudomonadota bacterium]
MSRIATLASVAAFAALTGASMALWLSFGESVALAYMVDLVMACF